MHYFDLLSSLRLYMHKVIYKLSHRPDIIGITRYADGWWRIRRQNITWWINFEEHVTGREQIWSLSIKHEARGWGHFWRWETEKQHRCVTTAKQMLTNHTQPAYIGPIQVARLGITSRLRWLRTPGWRIINNLNKEQLDNFNFFFYIHVYQRNFQWRIPLDLYLFTSQHVW